MKIALASGKGGTGKTTLAVGFAKAIDENITFLDCDVEEPNGHIFLDINEYKQSDVNILIPQVNPDLCNGCGACSKVCEFNAIAVMNKKPIVFPELCHSCGGCTIACPTNAISEKPKKIGVIEIAYDKNIKSIKGMLDVSNAMVPPVIRQVKKQALDDNNLIILDCPPGTSCPMITAVKDCDYAILTTEPTAFGLNDLVLAVETLRELKIPFGVIINRADEGDNRVVDYCNEEKIELLLEIPSKREVAVAYSKGESILNAMPELKKEFQNIYQKIKKEHEKGQK